MHLLAVAGQYPLESVLGQSPHGLGLLRPGVPTIILRRRELFLISVPIQVVAGKEETVLKEQNTVAGGVARCWDRKKIRSQCPWAGSIQHDFGTRLGGQLMAMDNATALELLGKTFRLGHIILMSQEDVGHTAQSLQLSYQRHDELGRVDQPIAV